VQAINALRSLKERELRLEDGPFAILLAEIVDEDKADKELSWRKVEVEES